MVALDDSHNAYDDAAWLEQSRADIAARYAKARRHSLVVRILRYALPLVSLAGVVLFVIIAYVLPDLPSGISAASIDVNNNSIVMKDPHVSGFLRGGRTYEIRAARAEQSLENTKVVSLDDITATIGLANGEKVKVVAKHGTYYSDTQRIELDKGIELTATNGATGTLQTASIDMASGTMVSPEPIDFRSGENRIQASGVHVADKGGTISFAGRVRVTYSVPDESKRPPANPSGEP